MLECPRCFWLHIVKKIKRPQMVFPSITNGMDRVLKEHFDRFMERGEIPPEIRGFNPILVLFEFFGRSKFCFYFIALSILH